MIKRSFPFLRPALAVLLLALPVAAAPDEDLWQRPDSPAAPFKLLDSSGKSLSSRSLAGKVVVVDFWATWCAPCLQELPELAEYHHKVKGDPQVVFLSFNVTDDRETIAEFVRERDIPYPVYLADDLMGPYELVGFPTKLILDMRASAPGVVRFRRVGYTPLESIEQQVRKVLQRRP